MTRHHGEFEMKDDQSFQSPDLLSPEAQIAVRSQLDAVTFAAVTADREVFRRHLPTITRDQLLHLTVVGAEARVAWIRATLACSQHGTPPTAAETAEIARHRATFEELSAAFEAIKRLIERGYTRLG